MDPKRTLLIGDFTFLLLFFIFLMAIKMMLYNSWANSGLIDFSGLSSRN